MINATTLPKYVQAELRRLESDNATLQRQLDAFTCTHPTPISVGSALSNNLRYIDAHAIDINTSKGRFHILITEDGKLKVSTSYDCIQINPCASNSIELSEERRER